MKTIERKIIINRTTGRSTINVLRRIIYPEKNLNVFILQGKYSIFNLDLYQALLQNFGVWIGILYIQKVLLYVLY